MIFNLLNGPAAMNVIYTSFGPIAKRSVKPRHSRNDASNPSIRMPYYAHIYAHGDGHG